MSNKWACDVSLRRFEYSEKAPDPPHSPRANMDEQAEQPLAASKQPDIVLPQSQVDWLVVGSMAKHCIRQLLMS